MINITTKQIILALIAVVLMLTLSLSAVYMLNERRKAAAEEEAWREAIGTWKEPPEGKAW